MVGIVCAGQRESRGRSGHGRKVVAVRRVGPSSARERRVMSTHDHFTVDEDGSGDIDATGIGGTMRVEEDGSGNIDVDRISGDFVVDHKGSGSVRYETVKGRVDIPERKRRS